MEKLNSRSAIYLFCILTLMGISWTLSAQPKHVDVLPSMPTPTVANLAKFCEFPEIDQNGIVPIEIPIWNLEYKGISIPITLKYQASGIRVGQESSWVGLGWNLEALCFITRSVRDIPDDLVKDRTVVGGDYEHYTYKGWLNQPGMYQDFPNRSDLSGTQSEKSAGFLCSNEYGVSRERLDAEPDVFFLKLGKIEESFVFNHSGNVALINPKQKLDVSKTYTLSNGISEFCVTDCKGNKYYFGSQSNPEDFTEKTKVSTTLNTTYNGYVSLESRNYSFDRGGIETMEFRTTWFLRKIVLINDPSTIDFTYTATEERFNVLLDKYYTLTEDQSQIQTPLVQGLWSGVTNINHISQTKYLTGITYAGGSISFSLNTRSDIDGAKKLTSLSIRNNNNTTIKSCIFSYSDQVTSGTEPVFDRTRMFLDGIMVSGGLNYQFDYYSKSSLPHKKSYKQDFWGYYSSKSTDLIPKIYVYPNRQDYLMYSCFPINGENSPIELPGSDRTVDADVINSGSLKSIKFPTGGYEEFIFESNDFYDSNWGEKNGGGLRISGIRYKDKNENIVREKNFHYDDNGVSSGSLINGLFFATPTAYNYGGINDYMGYSSTIQNSWDYFTLRRGNNYFPLISNDGALVSYTKVSIIESGNGRIEKEYNPPKNYKINATMVNWATTYNVDDSYFRGPDESFMERGSAYIDLYNYGLDTVSGTTYVPIYEMVDIDFWDYYGVNDYEFYFKYNDNYYLMNFTDPARPTLAYFRVDNEENNIIMGRVQKTGYNIFPFPPISDDNDFTRGKLIKESFFIENEDDPVKEIDYSYDDNGAGVDIYGVSYGKSLVYNFFFSPLPVQNDLSFITYYGENGLQFKEYNARLFQLPKNWGKYKIIGNVYNNVTNKVITEHTENGEVITTYDYEFNKDNLLTAESVTDGNGDVQKTTFRYPRDLNEYIGDPFTDEAGLALIDMADSVGLHMFDYPIEITKYRNDQVIESDLQLFKKYYEDPDLVLPFKNYKWESISPSSNFLGIYFSTNPSSPLVFDSDYCLKTTFEEYDESGNLQQLRSTDNNVKSFSWGYDNLYPVAAITNASEDKIYYTSFEEDAAAISNSAYSKTGGKYYLLTGIYQSAKTFPAGTYTLTYFWRQTTYDPWEQIQETKTLTSSGLISTIKTSGYIDELRIHPIDALMTTYTYDPLIGITSITDESCISMHYGYDSYGRLVYITDDLGNIIKTIDYHYQDNQ